jgi:hypothetical protein
MLPVIHRPVVNANASRYVLIMMVSFAISVVGTRLYLELTGYPQIGNATFHFAHALWGGLLQIIAALLLLIYVNRWVYGLSAILEGVGVGLFIDEVGKFITQQNDYFFPLAAPIIYVVFLLTLLVYLMVKRQPSTNLRADMYKVLSDLEEVLEDDLSASERDYMLTRLQRIANQTERRDLAELAGHLLAFLQSGAVEIVPDNTSLVNRLLKRLKQFEDRFLSKKLARRILIVLYLVTGVVTLFSMGILFVLLTGAETGPAVLLTIFLEEPNLTDANTLNWFLAMMALDMLTGVLIFIGTLAFWIKRDTAAITLGIIALVITLTFTNTLSFYFNQFSIVLNSLYSFLVLLALLRYRDRFVRDKHAYNEEG